VKPVELLNIARTLTANADRQLGGTWGLAAALLLRQALEDTLDEFWVSALPGAEACSGRVQLICLPFYLSDKRLAAETASAWSRLSTVCHHSTVEMPPSLVDLDNLAATVERLIAAVTA